LKSPILITEATRRQVGEGFITRRVCAVRVVNIHGAVELYELYAAEDAVHSVIRTPYEQALALFEQQNFRGAAQLLSDIVADYPDDGPALVLLSRSVNHLVHPPARFDPAWELPGK
jgi:adenylate cyclase